MRDDRDNPQSPELRELQPSTQLNRAEFMRRIGERFYDPAFDLVRSDLERVLEAAWDGYHQYRKSPRRQKGGPEFADPDFPLPIEWLKTRHAIRDAERKHNDPSTPRRVLLVSAAARSSQ